jgi:hypothetical protein
MEQAETLEKQSYSLRSINGQLTAISGQLQITKDSLRVWMKAAKMLVVILAVWIALKLIRIFAGIKWPALDVILPRWVDIVI